MDIGKIYSKKFPFNLMKIRITPHEVYIRIFLFKFRWRYRQIERGTPCSVVDPYAFIRVHNEKQTLRCSLNSILPVITKGIIAYHDCTDGSEEIIGDFCTNNPGFVPARYDFFHLYKNETLSEKLTRYYNWALSLMPRNEWLVKIDVDQIYDAEKLRTAFRLPKTTKDVIMLPRIELHYDGNELFAIASRPFNFSTDHWLIFNDGNLFFTECSGYDFEMLVIYDDLQRRKIYSEITNWHFPVIKSAKRIWYKQENLRLVRFGEWINAFDGNVLDEFCNVSYPAKEVLDRKMMSESRIMEFVKQFEKDTETAGG